MPGKTRGGGSSNVTQYGLRRDFSEALRIPFIPTDAPKAEQLTNLELPLYDYQLRNIHRMRTIEGYADGTYKSFNTFLEYKPRGGVIADSTGMGKTASVIGLALSEPHSLDVGPNIVVTPSHLFAQWKQEIEKFAGTRSLVIAGFAEYDRLTPGELQAMSNHDFVVVDVKDVLTKSKKKWYDFRKVFIIPSLKLGSNWVRVMNEETETVSHYRNKVTGVCQNNRPECYEPDWSSARRLSLSTEIVEKYRASARFVAGAYAGWVYDGRLHWPAKAHRRVIFDEVHDLIESDETGVGSVPQNNFIQLSRNCKNVWLMSATPFPKGNRSVFGLHQLLGFHRLKLDVEVEGGLPHGHTFEIIKRKLYVKNHHSVKEAISSKFNVTEDTLSVRFGNAEAAFYHGTEQTIVDCHGQASLYSRKRDEQRRMCCHPAASVELRAAFEKGGGGDAHGNNTSMEDMTKKMVNGRKQQLEQKQRDLRSSLAKLHRVVNSRRIFEKVEKSLQEAEIFRESKQMSRYTDGTFHDQNPFAWVENLDEIKDLCVDTHPACAMYPFNPSADSNQSSLRDPHMVMTIENAEAVRDYVKRYLMDSKEFRAYYGTQARSLVERLSNRVNAMNREVKELQNQSQYFQNIFETIENAGSSGPTCPICLGESLSIAFPDCGHFVCRTCMDTWLSQRGSENSCPSCRKELNKNNIVYFVCNVASNGDELTDAYGAKPAALAKFLKEKVLASNGKAIVFSMWDDVLHIVSRTLVELAIPNIFCKGSGSQQSKAIMDYVNSSTVNVLMLSACASANGANLQCANHIILLDPPGHNAAHGAALEQQAIARSVRLGQKRPVTVTRFVVADTIEAGIFAANKKATQSLRRKEMMDHTYVCDDVAPSTSSTSWAPPTPPASVTRKKRKVDENESGQDTNSRHLVIKRENDPPPPPPPLAEPKQPLNKVDQLVAMGFTDHRATKALDCCNWDIARAVDMILTGNLP